jgi:hypothetical protein
VQCVVEELTIKTALEQWGRASELAPEPGAAEAVEISTDAYVKIWGAMGEEQASQWAFFRKAAEMGVSLQSIGVVDGMTLLEEEERAGLLSTEESWRRMDWKGYGVPRSLPRL